VCVHVFFPERRGRKRGRERMCVRMERSGVMSWTAPRKTEKNGGVRRIARQP
jgi:hypothetical protein